MTWAKFDDGYPLNDKSLRAGLEGVGFDACGICYCARNLTDGFISDGDLPLVYPPARNPKRFATKLVEAGRWKRVKGGYQIHDYLEYNPSRAEVLAKREARSKAGSKGGSKSPSKRTSKTQANASTNGEANREANTQAPGNPVSRIPVPLGDESTSQTALAERLSAACTIPDLIGATSVVETLAEHIDVRLIDECIGWAEQRDEKNKPRSPRFFLTTVPNWAEQRGVAMPDLTGALDT